MQPDASGSEEGAAEAITVVLADDAEDVRLMLRLALQREGDISIVGEAADGTRVVQLAAAHQPSAVVLDLEMPGGGGIEAVAAIHRVAPRAKIIVVSGHDRSSNWEQASAAGAAAYVQKGGRPSDITALIRSLARG